MKPNQRAEPQWGMMDVTNLAQAKNVVSKHRD